MLGRRHVIAGGALALLGPAAIDLARADALSSGAFRDEVAAILRRSRPDLRVIMPDDPDTIVIDTPATEIRIFLGNLYADMRAFTGDARRDAILEFLTKATDAAIPERAEPAWPEAKGRLWVQIVPVAYGSQQPTLVSRPLTPRVQIAYALLSGETYTLVGQDMLKRWNVAADAVHDAAVFGLESASEAVPIDVMHADRGARTHVAMGGGFDAARLLLPRFMARLRAALGTPTIIGIPTWDLLVAWTPDFSARAQVAGMIDRDSQPGSHSHPLTNELFVATAEGVRPATEAETAARRGG